MFRDYGDVLAAAGIPPCEERPRPNGRLGAAQSDAAGANAVERWATKLLADAHERFEAEYGEIGEDECRRLAAAGWTRALRIAIVGCELRVSFELVPPADAPVWARRSGGS
jgi:hypothetical protein